MRMDPNNELAVALGFLWLVFVLILALSTR